MKRMQAFKTGAVMAAIAAAATLAKADPTVDGTRDVSYGSALTTNINPTGFGDSNYTAGPNTPDANGSETDAAYGQISGGFLYLFLAGNSENNGNHWNVFVSDGRAGQSTLSVPATGSMQSMNGSVFSPGFQATYALDINDFQGTVFCDEYTLTGPGTLGGGFTGSFAIGNGGIGTGSGGTTATIGINNSNIGGVTGSTGSTITSLAVATGLELAIPLADLGNSTGPFDVLADINGGGDGFLSNQFLPGLAAGTGNLGNGGKFDFSATRGEFFTVSPAAVPEPTTLGLLAIGALPMLARRRRA
jgi:hypothetical protein